MVISIVVQNVKVLQMNIKFNILYKSWNFFPAMWKGAGEVDEGYTKCSLNPCCAAALFSQLRIPYLFLDHAIVNSCLLQLERLEKLC